MVVPGAHRPRGGGAAGPIRPCSEVMRSGVVGRERMGTAFPHKKLSGNGVPTREILRNIVLGYEPAGLTMHPPQNDRGWVHFFRIGV